MTKRVTIAGLQAELSVVRSANEQLLAQLAEKERDLKNARNWATRHVELSDRLLNVLEWNAKEGRGYGK